MNDELELKLQQDFPFMKQDKNEEHGIYKRWGCECADGWYQLIHDLCQEITDRYEKDGVPVDLVIDQIKEKFAGLRFYYSYEDSPCAVHAFDFIGGASVRLYPENKDDKNKALRRDIADIVSKYEELSFTVCEECGKSGTVRKDLSWILTLCDDCYEKILERNKKRRKDLYK